MKRISVFKNVSIFLAFGVMGLVTCLIGATYVHMERLFDVSSNTMSLSLTGIYSGGLLGAGLCATLYHKINPEVNMALTNAMAGLSTIAAFYSSHFVVFAFFMTLQGVAFGVLFAAAPLYLITMWKDTKWNRPVLNCLYTFWSVGALIGPFIIRLFICHKEHFNEHLPSNVTNRLATNSGSPLETSFLHNVTEPLEGQFSKSCLEWAQSAYLVMGSILFCTSLPFCAVFVAVCCTPKRKPIETISMEPLEKNEAKKDGGVELKYIVLQIKNKTFLYKLVVSILLFLFIAFTISIECITVQYIVTFTTNHLNWSVRSSSFLITVFFTSHSISRGSNIFMSIYCKPIFILPINILLCILAYSLLILFIHKWPYIIYFSVFLVGFSVASTYPNEILLVSENVHFTQSMSAIAIIGSSMGGIVSPYLLTSLIGTFGHHCFVHFQISTSLLLLILFLLQTLFFKKFS